MNYSVSSKSLVMMIFYFKRNKKFAFVYIILTLVMNDIYYVQMSVVRITTIIIITTYAIKLNFIDRLQFVFDVIYTSILFEFRTCLFHSSALTTKSINFSGYTSISSNV